MQRLWKNKEEKEMKHAIPEWTYSEIEQAINQKIIGKHSARDREIMRSRLLDGLTFEEIAELYRLCVRQVYNIVYKCENKIFR